jgi:hypothetical protein
MHKSGGLLLAACLAWACGGQSALPESETSDAAPDGRLREDAESQRVECIYAEDCKSPVALECERTGDCTFQWAEPLHSVRVVSLDGGELSSSDWTISEDGLTLSLSGATCEVARKASSLRIRLEFPHSCIF